MVGARHQEKKQSTSTFFVVEVVDHGVGRDLTFSHVIGRGHAQTSIGAVQNPQSEESPI